MARWWSFSCKKGDLRTKILHLIPFREIHPKHGPVDTWNQGGQPWGDPLSAGVFCSWPPPWNVYCLTARCRPGCPSGPITVDSCGEAQAALYWGCNRGRCGAPVPRRRSCRRDLRKWSPNGNYPPLPLSGSPPGEPLRCWSGPYVLVAFLFFPYLRDLPPMAERPDHVPAAAETSCLNRATLSMICSWRVCEVDDARTPKGLAFRGG